MDIKVKVMLTIAGVFLLCLAYFKYISSEEPTDFDCYVAFVCISSFFAWIFSCVFVIWG